MKVVFMGTPQLAAAVLEAVANAHEVVGVYTRPDAVRGRGKKLVASPVKQAALDRGIPVFTPKTLGDEGAIAELRALRPDVICVAAYGCILPAEVLDIPPYGCLNVHTSLLPRWRGAAPMQRAILAHDAQVGVCIMRMEEGLDTGPFCRRVSLPLDELYLKDVERELAREGGVALVDALAAMEASAGDDIAHVAELEWTTQASEDVTYAAKIDKGELDLDPREAATESCAKVRASDDAHPARTTLDGRRLTVERAHVANDEQARDACEGLQAGQAVFRAKRMLAMCADGPMELEQVKPDGKKSMDARAFAAGIQGVKSKTLEWGTD